MQDFQQFETVRSFDDKIYTDKVNIDEAEIDQNSKRRQRKKRDTYKNLYALYEG